MSVRNIAIIMALLLIVGPLFPASSTASAKKEAVIERIRNRLEAAGCPPVIEISNELIYASQVLPAVYEQRGFEPVWSDGSSPLPRVNTLISAIREAYREGLRPSDYHLKKIETFIKIYEDPKKTTQDYRLSSLVDLDLLCTDAFLIFGSHLLAGRINPETIDPEWRANRREADLARILENALRTQQIGQALRDLLPPQEGYWMLREALVRYRELEDAGGWPLIPDGPRLQKGAEGKRIALLKLRLTLTGDLEPLESDTAAFYDDRVEEAVRYFQKRHGLEVVGYVGPLTLAALNVPVQERVHQIELNLERWRWLPQDLGSRYILINIADFELQVVEDNTEVLRMRVVVGRDYRRTPVFSDNMTYLVLSPYWNVPPGIAVNDILPETQKDPNYLIKKNIRVFQGWGSETVEIDPLKVDWLKITPEKLSYRFRQDPGPANALGDIKFMFPNKYNVYLHDTPSRELFEKPERTFSSGCIRIEKPLALAEYLLRDQKSWNRDKLLAVISQRQEQSVKLTQPVQVHLLYWTAWVDKSGVVQFRRDVYSRDKLLYDAITEHPPEQD